ncbi:transcriptional antiterminator [Tetragenococcus osmophilus]|uniref:PTS sugar transporter n=1 Tax=Tetragenococcus osmophilus TaxID=526944 RepID=A0AA37XM24_9ENTE|nr:PRD domain-containing protein [Tetragenococcus osmophilus]AYW47321.1 transcriptional antiterminator [Tetragenococcus osmophilus]GMA52858.1 PTS sugar transporter [Alicyclobacillus contaminans]GMA73147.1 PTS sugar transporter [Tetragenococcus osmophilus]
MYYIDTRNKGGDIINTYELEIINLLLSQDTVHYSDIGEKINRSKKTIAKYLDHIEGEVLKYGVKLNRKRNVGIYFTGNTKDLALAIQDGELAEVSEDREERIVSIFSTLLMCKKPILIQELADSLYISRSTLENDLVDIKKRLNDSGATLQNTHQGIYIEATEKDKRKLLSQLLEMYWGKSNFRATTKKNTTIDHSILQSLSRLFDSKTVQKVLESLSLFQEKANLKLDDYEYQSLTVHLVIAIERLRKGEPLLGKDLDISQDAIKASTKLLVTILEDSFCIKLPEDEQKYINIHILAAETDNKNVSDGVQVVNLETKDDLDDFLRQSLTDYDEVLINNLLLHLIPAIKRFSLGLNIYNPYTAETKKFFSLAYNMAVDLSIELKKTYKVNIDESEIAFIALHIQAYLERKETKKVEAVIVCSTGLGTARLLEQRVKKNFSDRLKITRVVSLQEIKAQSISEELVISTVNMQYEKVPVIKVSPFLDDFSANAIDNKVDELIDNHEHANAFMNLIEEDLITFDDKVKTKEEVIHEIGNQLVENDYGEIGIGAAAVNREKVASTKIGFVATPHAPVNYVKKPCISLYINPEGVTWDHGKVKLIFFLAMNESIKPDIQLIYQHFNDILENNKRLKKILHLKNKDEITSLLRGN